MRKRYAKDNLQSACIYSFLDRGYLPIFILYYLSAHLITNEAATGFIDGETLVGWATCLKLVPKEP